MVVDSTACYIQTAGGKQNEKKKALSKSSLLNCSRKENNT